MFIEASSLITTFNPAEQVDEYKLEMLYQMILKDLSLLKYSLDFNDIKQLVIKLKIPLSEFSHWAVTRTSIESTKYN